MSMIASFYLVPSNKAEGLVAAAEAQNAALTKKRWGIFGPKLPLDPDPFWDYLNANARELEDFPYRGALLVDVEILVPDALESDHPLGKRLSGKDSSYISYSPVEAAAAVEILSKADFSHPSVEEFLRSEGRTDDVRELMDALEESRRHMTDWLRQVSNEELGLLSIG